MTTTTQEQLEGLGTYKFGWADSDVAGASARRGLSEEVVRDISARKNEPEWMLEMRLKGLKNFGRKPMPNWGADLTGIDFDNIKYFVRSTEKQAASWDELPADIKNTYDRLGIPEAEKQRLIAGVAAQYESEVVYHKIREDLEEKGVLFLDTDTALREQPDLFREYFGTVIPPGDNKFAALNTAVWSGGSFIYVPKNVKVEIPLQAYFRINTENMGQFERTLIIVDEGAYVHYVEGCTAPIYKSDSLHSAVVEIIVKKDARCRYTTIQNWSNNVYNLVTKRAVAQQGATMEWIDGNIGSKVTMKYPAVYLMGEHARGETLSVAFAGEGQHQDAGGKIVHAAPNTTSNIFAKSISKDGGIMGYRGLVKMGHNSAGSKARVQCDGLMMDGESKSDTWPDIQIQNPHVTVAHEATVGRISDDQLFYMGSRGFTEDEAAAFDRRVRARDPGRAASNRRSPRSRSEHPVPVLRRRREPDRFQSRPQGLDRHQQCDQRPDPAGIELADEHDLVAREALAHHPPLGGAVHQRRDGQEGQREARLREVAGHALAHRAEPDKSDAEIGHLPAPRLSTLTSPTPP